MLARRCGPVAAFARRTSPGLGAGLDTLTLAARLHLDTTAHVQDLVREIVVSMLMGPVVFEFPSVDELMSAVRIRVNIVQAARKTTLAFHTSEAERPADYWVYDEDRGFITRPSVSLIRALEMATQPGVSGALYSFSCYRASEYLILLGIAQELAHCNPPLYAQLQSMWGTHPIKSGKFHDVFLHTNKAPWRRHCHPITLFRVTGPGFVTRTRRPRMHPALRGRG